MLPCCLEDEPELLTKGAGAEEKDHDEGMRKTDFGAVDGAIADGFEKDERLMVFGVEDDLALDVALSIVLERPNRVVTRVAIYLKLLDVRHGEE